MWWNWPESLALARRPVEGVAPDPGQEELEEGIGTLLRGTIGVLVDLHSDPARILGALCANEARLRKGLDVELVDLGQDPQIVVHHAVALFVAHSDEVGAARHYVHHVGARLIDPAVDARDGNAALVQHALQRHLLLEQEADPRIEAVAAYAQLQPLAVAIELCEPNGTPARLQVDVAHHAAEMGLEPTNDLIRSC